MRACADATSYSRRRNRIWRAAMSKSTYEARGSPSRGYPTLPTLMKSFWPNSYVKSRGS